MREPSAEKKQVEIDLLADQASECISLVATNILSLRQWHYLKAENNSALSWFSIDWLKAQALDFAMTYTKTVKKNDKFLNQLLSLSIYEYATLPKMSENLLNMCLLYHTLNRTEIEEKKQNRAEGSKEPNQVVLEKFFNGALKTENSRVNFK